MHSSLTITGTHAPSMHSYIYTYMHKNRTRLSMHTRTKCALVRVHANNSRCLSGHSKLHTTRCTIYGSRQGETGAVEKQLHLAKQRQGQWEVFRSLSLSLTLQLALYALVLSSSRSHRSPPWLSTALLLSLLSLHCFVWL